MTLSFMAMDVECSYAECRDLVIIMLNVIMLSVALLSAIMFSVVFSS
jgi:hypothetical protein